MVPAEQQWLLCLPRKVQSVPTLTCDDDDVFQGLNEFSQKCHAISECRRFALLNVPMYKPSLPIEN